jgi:hypothetical protein
MKHPTLTIGLTELFTPEQIILNDDKQFQSNIASHDLYTGKYITSKPYKSLSELNPETGYNMDDEIIYRSIKYEYNHDSNEIFIITLGSIDNHFQNNLHPLDIYQRFKMEHTNIETSLFHEEFNIIYGTNLFICYVQDDPIYFGNDIKSII